MKNITLKQMGMTDQFLAAAGQYSGLYAGRVVSQYKDAYRVMTEEDTLMAEVSGRLRYGAAGSSDFPAVGDFVMLDRQSGGGGNAIIHQVLPRKSAFIRKAAGTAQDGQVVASNIDTVFICMAMNHDFNLRRLERYLAIGWDSGAAPVVVLTKSDLCENPAACLAEVQSVAVGADVLLTTALDGAGVEPVLPYMKPGRTVAFIGSSGVGKSTLINRLTGEENLATNGLRNDDRGRHTTTRRELILLAGGAMVIDTPGMRELGVESADLDKAFSDIEALARACKFRDCTHTAEPGCAVQKAVEDGALDPQRLASYHKLKKEAGYEGLNAREIEAKKLERMFGSVGGMKNARRVLKDKDKRKYR
ncbi:ribosome small subunit-dependent GTPase A [Eubacterium sp. 1001713B170207_170306_E7]|uniref:ribosome small subunit-dependent GTPase A n=1 Tax=Eubacterium sp. 1001713B170207_170306_E7 TaxID=2787097 RepID=UPI00189BB28C|nr:ribosome small subunit-dependent GTPase A [Eubacterium sp. 1001713B170207_170306_E7]